MPEVKRQLRRGRNGEIGHAIRAADGDVLEIGTTVTLLAEPEAVQADLPGRVGKCAQLIMAGAVGLCVRGIICPVHRDETVHVDIREGLSAAVGHDAADPRRGLTNYVIDVRDVHAVGHGENHRVLVLRRKHIAGARIRRESHNLSRVIDRACGTVHT